ncbi:GntR family transcriptional regulator [Sporolactobacillus pectinivorans]|uniref:GntR family transcriptional regulator n=1 Tax=Sporolactobacillus pectinivorans TaxID=1591408 RepID=UPI00138FD4CC|nr:GntR family transcriptional regulator [Sporolactobacillus pectinivorans]
MAKYKEVAEDMQRKIRAHAFGKKLPTEKELLEMYSVSRNTIRSAINILVKQGYIHKIQGSGLYINKKTIGDRNVLNLAVKIGLSRVLPEHSITSKLLNFGLISADKKLASNFSCDIGTPIYRVKRLRFIDNHPLSIEDSYYNKNIIKYLNEDIAKNSIYSYIENDLKLEIRFSDEYISVKPLTDEECEHLNVQKGSSSLMIREINYLKSSIIFNISETLYNNDQIVLYTPVQRD